jgi:hypothetical protein
VLYGKKPSEQLPDHPIIGPSRNLPRFLSPMLRWQHLGG